MNRRRCLGLRVEWRLLLPVIGCAAAVRPGRFVGCSATHVSRIDKAGQLVRVRGVRVAEAAGAAAVAVAAVAAATVAAAAAAVARARAGAMVVSPSSPRAQVQAPVRQPVAWVEVGWGHQDTTRPEGHGTLQRSSSRSRSNIVFFRGTTSARLG